MMRPGLTELLTFARRSAAVAAALLVVSGPAVAEPVLTLNNAGLAAGSESLSLDETAINALPQHTLRTRNEFVDDVTEFTGPLAIDVINMVGRGSAKKVRLTASNDYAIEIDLKEFEQYEVIFATAMNGKRLSPREKGPVWVIYPMDQHTELQDPSWNSRLIWQLVKVELL